ncbi:Alpha-D-glucose-1-phosphate phosphatase YihX [Diaporthe amygdali]|uniref:Alpha-D-glucose-1-phosphate phosphatase YihX n=1 Tax=Phomopsis amygdali TaxID=1214568 RepID=UPI0022FDCB15|nr:Alpha-D-glucose-1-phosphate phosphatase YihX [Diaporthe amygdali]KAJ0120464.1 Alpha-D-glucose-1-phosphate phosphatase YihX [Diaporthe amygdali]
MDLLLPPPRAVIFDLGDVLFTWSATTASTIPARQLRDILSTPIWFAYDRGEITRDVCYQLSAEKFCLSASEIAEAFRQARKSLQPDPAILALLREINKNPTIQVYVMSNIGKEDFQDLATRIDWSLFNQVFTSAAAGMRKPELGFYKHVLDHIGLAGNEIVFIDDKEENIRAAQALGIRGHVFEHSTIHGVAFADNFAKLLIADTLQNKNLIDLYWGSKKTWNFFNGDAALIPGGQFPDDLDTTSLALQVLQPPSKELVSTLLNEMAEYANQDGTFQAARQTYFDRIKVRDDPIVSANILACFYSYGRGHEFQDTLKLMTLGPLLKSRVNERLGHSGNALDLAMRIITCKQMGIECQEDQHTLLSMQCDDGSWEPGWMYQYGSTGVKIGNRGVTTAMAVAALSIRDESV